MLKLWLVYYVTGIQICLLSTKQVLQFGLRVENDKSSFTFHNKSGDTIILATLNFWDNIQIVRTHILKNNIHNSVSLLTRYLNFETLHCCFKHVFNKVMYHILDKITKKIYFPTQKHVCYSCIFSKIHQHDFSENLVYSSKPFGLIYLDFLELLIMSYFKCKQMIMFIDDYFFYCNIAFLYKKSKAVEAIKSIFQIQLNTAFNSVKSLYTDNRGEYILLELQPFLKEQGIIHETSTLHVYQQNSCAK